MKNPIRLTLLPLAIIATTAVALASTNKPDAADKTSVATEAKTAEVKTEEHHANGKIKTVSVHYNVDGKLLPKSMEEYDEKMALLELYEKLGEGEQDLAAGRVKTLDQVSAMIKESIAK